MVDQLLWIEALFKGSLGLIMLLTPLTAARVVGLPHGASPFWPRLFGAALLAITAAIAVEGYSEHIPNTPDVRGLGLGGAIAINFVTLLALIGALVFRGVPSRRGKLLLWVISLFIVFLMLLEIAHV